MPEIPHDDSSLESSEIIDAEPREMPDDSDEDTRDSEQEQELEVAVETLPEELDPSPDTDEALSEESVESESRPEAALVDEISESELESAPPERSQMLF